MYILNLHFTVAAMAALWQMLFVSFILSQDTEDQQCPLPLSWAWSCPDTFSVFFGLHEWVWAFPSCVGNNRLSFGGLLLWPLNLCEAEMKRVALVFISPVNYWYILLRNVSQGLRWEDSTEVVGRSDSLDLPGRRHRRRRWTVRRLPQCHAVPFFRWLLFHLSSSSIIFKLEPKYQ